MVQIENHAVYSIVNAKAGTVMDLSGADNRSVIGYPNHGGKNQQWQLIHNDDGWFLRNVDRETFLAVDGEVRDNASVIAREQPFAWHLEKDQTNPGAMRILVPNTQENIDLTDYGNVKPGTPIAIWGRWNPGENQTWFFEKVEGHSIF